MSTSAAPRRATLRSIADRLGVSTATVSNAYNRPERLSAGLRARVLDTAAELGYPGPDPAGRSLRTGRAGALGVIFTEPLAYAFEDAAAAEFLAGVSAACEAARSALVLVPAAAGAGPEPATVRRALVDGFLAYSMPDGDPLLAAARQRGVPLVVVDQPRDLGVPFVGIDDRGAARAAAAHLLALGHQRLAVIAFRLAPDGRTGPAGPARQHAATYALTRERLAGYREAVEAAGRSWDDVGVHETFGNTPEAGRDAAGALLDAPRPPTALLAMSDGLALGALQAAAARGMPVPGGLSVVGFDDVPAAAAAEPALTTIRQDGRGKGRRAAERLLGLAPATGDLLLPTRLVTRASTGPA
jgi:DNA-binding LacI/PurR family transcriptional regulator